MYTTAIRFVGNVYIRLQFGLEGMFIYDRNKVCKECLYTTAIKVRGIVYIYDIIRPQ